MLSLKTTFLAAATLLASAVRADYYIDPDSVSLSTRTTWCQQELTTCPLICEQTDPGTTLVNTCDPVCHLQFRAVSCGLSWLTFDDVENPHVRMLVRQQPAT